MAINKYPYTSFNEYNLDFLLDEMKRLTVEWAETKTEWSDMKTELTDLKNYITHYFENLDVQEEIDKKLDEMVEDGTLSALIYPYVQAVIPDVQDVVETWLTAHVDPDTGYVIDKSLTIGDAAADAEVVGVRFDEISSTTANLYRNLDPDVSVPAADGYKNVMLENTLSAGDYTVACRYVTNASGKKSKLQFSTSQTENYVPGNTIVGEVTFPDYDASPDGWSYGNLTLTDTVYQVRFLSATTVGGSTGIPAEFYDIMIVEDNDNNINYVKPHTALDWKFRGIHLSPTGDTTDRTDEIERALTEYGRVILDPGEYTVYRVLMPEGTILEGSGYNTIVYLKDTLNADDYAIRLHADTAVMNMRIKGTHDVSDLTVEGNQIGLLFSGSTRKKGIIQNCWLEDFDRSGILLHATTSNVDQNVLISNCFISTCHFGIYIKANSEYHKITNCNINNCYYGILNRGGNNIIDNCGIDSNFIGIQVDADEGTNNGHGSISNCTINHSDNTGYGLLIKDTGRMLVSNCNIHYSNILISNSDGNILNGLGFGKDANVTITGGSCTLMIGCMLRSNLNTITKNSASKVVNCYYRDGTPVV